MKIMTLLLLVCCIIAGCGQSGRLYLPEQAPKQQGHSK